MSTSKVVIVEYRCQDAFKVPKGMDLEDKTKVEDWYVKWNILHINLVDGTELEIHSEWDAQDDFSDCMKHPIDEPTIEDAKDYGFDDEEEEDNTVVTGIVCRKCDKELPPHTASDHLDVTNKIHECPHVVE